MRRDSFLDLLGVALAYTVIAYAIGWTWIGRHVKRALARRRWPPEAAVSPALSEPRPEPQPGPETALAGARPEPAPRHALPEPPPARSLDEAEGEERMA